MAKILILIATHLCSAPRPQKEADTLFLAGHDVTVRGCWFDRELVERDRILLTNKKWRFEPIIDFQPTTIAGRWRNWRVRIHSRITREKFKRFGIVSPELLGYGVKAMLRAAYKARADLTIVHSEGGLWVGDRLLDKGFRVGVDFEDWFSLDLLPEAQANRPLDKLKALERRLARDCSYCLTTSHALADAIASSNLAPKPTVVYNVFPWAEREQLDYQKRDRHNLKQPSLHWFSQTIGPGRGLETLFQALPKLTIPIEIHLRGNYPEHYRQCLEPFIPDEWRSRIFIHPTVPNSELLSRIAEHDIGLALECPEIPSRNFTITNKLFQYLQAGLAVIATDTAGQREIFSHSPGIGKLIPSNNPIALAQAIEELLRSPDNLAAAKTAALQAAENQFCWEKQADYLLEAAEMALIDLRIV